MFVLKERTVVQKGNEVLLAGLYELRLLNAEEVDGALREVIP